MGGADLSTLERLEEEKAQLARERAELEAMLEKKEQDNQQLLGKLEQSMKAFSMGGAAGSSMAGGGSFNPMMNPMGMNPMMMNPMGMGPMGMNPMMMNPMLMNPMMNPMMNVGFTGGFGSMPMLGAPMGMGIGGIDVMSGMGMTTPDMMANPAMAQMMQQQMLQQQMMQQQMMQQQLAMQQATAMQASKAAAVTTTSPSPATKQAAGGQSKQGSVAPSTLADCTTIKNLIARKQAAQAESVSAKAATVKQAALTVSMRQKFESVDRGVDLLFIVDVTGSMEPWIAQVREKISLIIEEQKLMAPGRPLRIAFAGYRDHTDMEQFKIIDFMESSAVETFRQEVGSIRATGGGDAPEDIAGAFSKIPQLSWRSRTKLIIHIADAPCHGKKYHDCKDSYPEGDPSGLIPETMLSDVCSENKIDYYFVEINQSTSKMLSIFRDALSACDGVVFKVHPLGANPSELVKAVMESLAISLSAGGIAPLPPSAAATAASKAISDMRSKAPEASILGADI